MVSAFHEAHKDSTIGSASVCVVYLETSFLNSIVSVHTRVRTSVPENQFKYISCVPQLDIPFGVVLFREIFSSMGEGWVVLRNRPSREERRTETKPFVVERGCLLFRLPLSY